MGTGHRLKCAGEKRKADIHLIKRKKERKVQRVKTRKPEK
jgi:hypothetical protein